MTDTPPFMPNDDYEAIEAAVMETARGRWFLAEFARRNRTADTALLLAAIERLENLVATGEPPAPRPHQPVNNGALVSSASSELFAVEPAHAPPVQLPPPSIPDEVAWLPVDDEPETRFAPPDIVEIDDDADLIYPSPDIPPAQAAPRPAPEPAAWHARPAPEPPAPQATAPRQVPEFAAAQPASRAQSSMLAAALAQAEKTAAHEAAELPAVAQVVSTAAPPAADPAELDALSFEEKSVYFA